MSPSKYIKSSEEDTTNCCLYCSDVPPCWEVRLQCHFQWHTQRREGRERKEERKGGGEGERAKSWGRKAAEVGEKLQGHSSTPPSGLARNGTADLAQWRPVIYRMSAVVQERWFRQCPDRKPRAQCSEGERLRASQLSLGSPCISEHTPRQRPWARSAHTQIPVCKTRARGDYG